jgi:hypothetical protein
VHDRETGGPQFYFPGLSIEEEANALDRLHDWADNDANAMILGSWMARVDSFQTHGICGCPAWVADREGRA